MLTSIITKKCSACKQLKDITEFGPRADAKDGRRNQCRPCRQEHITAWYHTEEGKRSSVAILKRYLATENGRELRKQAHKRYSQTMQGRAKALRNTRKYRDAHPNYVAVLSAVYRAVQSGRLPSPRTLPCTFCNGPSTDYHHHLGYAKEHWLDVVPTCRRCHIHEHRKP